MAKNSVKRPPLSSEEKIAVKNDKLTQLYLLTGIRREELFSLLSSKIEGDAWSILGKRKKYRYVPYNSKIENLINELKPRWSKIKNLRSINQHYETISKKIGFKITPHRLRATFATDLIQNGVDLVTIQTLMGHSSVSQTAEYVVLSFARLSAATHTLIDKNYSIEGLSIFELQEEVIRLRSVNSRLKQELEIILQTKNLKIFIK